MHITLNNTSIRLCPILHTCMCTVSLVLSHNFTFCSSAEVKPVWFDTKTNLIDGNGGIITMERWGIQMSIPPGAVRRPVEISISALWNAPYLEMQDGEMLAACGLQCNPSGLDFHSPVRIRIPHCANFPASAEIQVVLYTSDSDTGKYIQVVFNEYFFFSWEMVMLLKLQYSVIYH